MCGNMLLSGCAKNGISTANLSMVLQQIEVILPVEQLLQTCGQLLLLQLLWQLLPA